MRKDESGERGQNKLKGWCELISRRGKRLVHLVIHQSRISKEGLSITKSAIIAFKHFRKLYLGRVDRNVTVCLLVSSFFASNTDANNSTNGLTVKINESSSLPPSATTSLVHRLYLVSVWTRQPQSEVGSRSTQFVSSCGAANHYFQRAHSSAPLSGSCYVNHTRRPSAKDPVGF